MKDCYLYQRPEIESADPYAKPEKNLRNMLAVNTAEGDTEGAETCRRLLHEIEIRKTLDRYAS